jgi:hypothetical protein
MRVPERAVCAGLLLLACAPLPRSPAEFRTEVKNGAAMTEVISFDSDRPFSEVAKAFREKAPECLNSGVKTTAATSTSYQVIVAIFKPTVTDGDGSVELAVQRKYTQGVMGVRDEPPDGHYVLVADARPAGDAKTHVDIYAPTGGIDALVAGVKSWAHGETGGCPDLTKD